MARPHGFKHTEITKKKLSEALKGKERSKEHRKNIALAKIGSKNGAWKGDKAKYSSIHDWIRKYWGRADLCEYSLCEGKSKTFDWANITGNYNRERKNWKKLCRGCHLKLDRYKSISF